MSAAFSSVLTDKALTALVADAAAVGLVVWATDPRLPPARFIAIVDDAPVLFADADGVRALVDRKRRDLCHGYPSATV